MPKKVKVDANVCIGCGTCVAIAGKSFKMNAAGKSVAIDPPGNDEETLQKAIDSCPVKAIAGAE